MPSTRRLHSTRIARATAAIVAFCTGAAAQQGSDAEEYKALRSALVAWEEHEMAPFRQAIESAPEIAAFHAKINAATNGPKKNKKRAEELTQQMLKEFPGSYLGATTGPMETDPTKLKALMTEAFATFQTRLASTCFDPERPSLSDSAPCRERLKANCISFGGDGKGHLSAVVIDEQLQAKEVPFTTEERFRHDFPTAYLGEGPRFCKLASLAGVTFEPRYPAVLPTPVKGPTGFPIVFPEPDSLREQCFAVDIEAARAALVKLEDRFPDWASSFFPSEWRKNLDRREADCNRTVASACERSYVVSGQVILAYTTKGCEVREITAEDVDADIKGMAEAGLTRADQLKHSQLKEVILTCKAAFDHGYSWPFKQPTLEGCQKDKPAEKAPKRKRRTP